MGFDRIRSSRPLQLTAAVLLGVALAVGLLLWHGIRVLDQQVLIADEGRTLMVRRGDSLRRILTILEDEGVLENARFLGWIARAHQIDSRIKAGEYRLHAGLSARDLLTLLVSGQVVQYRVTIPEGLTLREALDVLHGRPEITPLLSLDNPGEIADLVGQSEWPEGWFLPETYAFTRGDSDRSLLLRAHAELTELLNTLWRDRNPDLPLASPYEALILASIIEKETAVAGERTQIAGVFIRRLQRGMRLQTDPTVIYGLGLQFDGNLTRRHLQDNSNPYNTYRIAGLPPTPIALPGRAALEAVFMPDNSDTLYFVARGDGTHEFSETLAEHEENVRQYQQVRRQGYRSTPQ